MKKAIRVVEGHTGFEKEQETIIDITYLNGFESGGEHKEYHLSHDGIDDH